MKRPPRQLRLELDIEEEIKKIADVTSLPEIEVIRQAVEAGARAIKANGYKMPLPLTLQVVEPPNPPVFPVTYSQRPDKGLHLNERQKKKKSSSSKDSGHKLAQDIVKKAAGEAPKAE